ncbi:MAG: HAD family hydrolase [Dysgonomonas sp.]
MKDIKNVLFDFGGVIISLNKQKAIDRFKEIGVANIEDYLNEFRQEGIFLALEEGRITLEKFNDEVRKLAGKDISDEDIASGWMAFLEGIPEYKFQLLKDLRKKYKVYLISNTNPVIMGWAESDQFSPTGEPITAFFDKCYYSYKIGSAKPEKAIYEYVIQDSGINPSETLFLDDGQSNIDMGKFFGFKVRLTNQDEDMRAIFI